MARKVLVVDDDELTLQILKAILDLEEFEVTTASDGDQALRAIEGDDFDVIVLDVMMPGADGYEVCRSVKDDPRTSATPVVLLTARDREDDRQAGKDAGCDAYLTKPFSPLALVETITDLGLGKGKR